ncbi:MAG: hypothetical protein WBD67_12025 [Terracidiphilus sp.]
MRDRRRLILIPLAALLAVLPLMVQGASCGHDFGFHVRNWLEVGSQWKQAVLMPHWDFTAAWDSGGPRFVFYPPLSWTIGAALGLFLPWNAVPTVFIWIALAACGLTMHRLACEWTTANNALIAACFYMVHPYMLFTFYERAAYAELLAAAWIPLLFLGILRSRVTASAIALPICLLWLTNDPAAVIGCYSFALLGLMRVGFMVRRERGVRARIREAATIAAGVVLGIGLAGFYIVPATVEQHWVQINMPFMRGVRYQDNFAFRSIGDVSHDAILRTASLCGVALIAASAIFFAIGFYMCRPNAMRTSSEAEVRPRTTLAALAVLTCVVAFLLTSPSALLWRQVPELKYLQFPWRFCAILGATAAALLALAMRKLRLHVFAAAAIAMALTLASTLVGDHTFRQPCYTAFALPAIVRDFQHGGHYDPTDEYTPAGADALAVRHTNPIYWLAVHPTDPAPATADNYSINLQRRLHFTVRSRAAGFVVLSLRDYPAWRITVNGANLVNPPRRTDGLIALPIARGVSRIDVAYALTPDQAAGWVVTAISAALLLLVWWRRKRAV